MRHRLDRKSIALTLLIVCMVSMGGLIGVGLAGGYDSQFLSGHITGSSGGPDTSWATYRWTSEVGWTGMTGTNIALMDTTSVANENSYGLVTGANLVYTQSGGVAAAVLAGGYYSRVFDGTDDYLKITQVLADTMKLRNSWSVIMRFKAYTASAGDIFFDIKGATDRIYAESVAGGISFIIQANSTSHLLGSTGAAPPAASDFFVWACGNGTNTYGGWSTTVPTVHTAVPANQRVQAASFGQFTATGFNDGTARTFMSLRTGADCLAGTLYGIIISQQSLVTY